MKTLTSTLTTTVIGSDDGTHCYEVNRTLENGEGEKAILLTLYPSFSGQDIHKLDATAMHLMNHMMYDLGMEKA